MDPTNCPDGLATDRVLLFPSENTCDSSIEAFIGTFIFISIFRLIVNLKQWQYWFRQSKQTAGQKKKPQDRYIFKRRMPIVPLLGVFAVVSLVLFTALVALNLANTGNGFSCLLVFSIFFPILANSSVFLHKIVRLGRKIIPISRNLNVTNESHLTRYDRMSIFLFASSNLAIVIIFAGLVILSPIERNFQSVQIGCAGAVVFDLGFALMLCWQIEKCIRAVKQSGFHTENTPDVDKKLAIAIQKMREQQLVIILLQTCAGLLWLLNFLRVVLLTWYIISIHVTIDSVVVLFSALTNRRHTLFSNNPRKNFFLFIRKFKFSSSSNSLSPSGPLDVNEAGMNNPKFLVQEEEEEMTRDQVTVKPRTTVMMTRRADGDEPLTVMSSASYVCHENPNDGLPLAKKESFQRVM